MPGHRPPMSGYGGIVARALASLCLPGGSQQYDEYAVEYTGLEPGPGGPVVRSGLTTIPSPDQGTARAKLRAVTGEQQRDLARLGLEAPDAHLVTRTVTVTAAPWRTAR